MRRDLRIHDPKLFREIERDQLPFRSPHPRTFLSKKGYKTVIVDGEIFNDVTKVYIVKRGVYIGKGGRIKRKRGVDYNRYGSVGLYPMGSDPYNLGRDYWETHSHVDLKLQNKGIGLYLYKRLIDYALRHGIKVVSSNSRNNKSDAVWQRLRKLYRIRYRKANDRFYVLGER